MIDSRKSGRFREITAQGNNNTFLQKTFAGAFSRNILIVVSILFLVSNLFSENLLEYFSLEREGNSATVLCMVLLFWATILWDLPHLDWRLVLSIFDMMAPCHRAVSLTLRWSGFVECGTLLTFFIVTVLTFPHCWADENWQKYNHLNNSSAESKILDL